MPTTASFFTKGNLHRIHFYLSQFAMEGIGSRRLLMSTKKNSMSLTLSISCQNIYLIRRSN
ncbi:uncharacterized protein DS421_17g583460 [Arachis hypogaea]|nr:uncharacterized protein DS421_17g583460 [Arachis hypogaea]